MTQAIRRLLPRGSSLPEDVWRRRHHTILAILWVHAGALAVFAVARGFSLAHGLLEGSLVAAATAAAYVPRTHRGKACGATLGLLASSAVLVHISGGAIEGHFHYFVMLGLVLLYQDWVPFLMYIGFVLFQHSVMGMLDPGSVYNHPAGAADPWSWGLIHALFIAGASAVGFVIWRSNEQLRENAEDNYRKLYEGERAVAHVKDELMTTVSHEFRTPLTAIVGFSRTMQAQWDDLLDSEKRHYLGVVERRAAQLSRMVDQLLTFSKIESAGIEVRPGAVGVAESLRNLSAAGETSGFEVRCDDDLWIAGDPDLLRQILTNYLSNARKYGAPPFSLDARRDGDVVEILVRDGGDGVPADLLPELFEKFVQGHAGTTREGFGLGLSIVRRTAQALGGETWYEPNSPKGSTFGVRLPASPAPARTGGADAPGPAPPTSEASATASSRTSR